MRANLPVFLDHVLCPFSGHLPDLEALKAAGDRLVVAVGEESGELLTALPAGRIAAACGGRTAVFPGGHTGLVEQPAAFAARLRATLDAHGAG